MSLSDAALAEAVTELALANYRRGEVAAEAALQSHGLKPQAPHRTPPAHEPELQPDPTAILAAPWFERVVTPEPQADASAARERLRAAITDRVATEALGRCDDLIAEIGADLAAQEERIGTRAAKLATNIREWITGGSIGERPMAGVPDAPGRTGAELAGAHAARLGLAADVASANAAHARAVEQVNNARRSVLAAAGQALAARFDAAEAVFGELRTEALALLNTRVAGDSVWHGSLPDRLTAAPPLARVDRDASSRWASFAARLQDDADAQFD